MSMDYGGPERRRGGPDRRSLGEKTRILLVDNHALFRVGMRNILEREPDFLIVGEAADSRSAIDMAVQLSPDIILMDLNLPAPGGIETTQRIKRELQPAGIIVLAVNEDEEALFEAIKAGAAAFILKDVGPDDLVTIIRRVFGGEYLINDKVFAKPAVASARPEGVPRAGRLRSGSGPDLRPAVPARGGDPRQHRAGHDEQAGRLRPVDQRADRQEPHEFASCASCPSTTGPRPSSTRCARAGSGCRRIERASRRRGGRAARGGTASRTRGGRSGGRRRPAARDDGRTCGCASMPTTRRSSTSSARSRCSSSRHARRLRATRRSAPPPRTGSQRSRTPADIGGDGRSEPPARHADPAAGRDADPG